jgi:predicted O-methyltransferase YrrM
MKLFQTIEELIPKMDGWCSVEKAFVLASTVIAFRPKVSVEIGIFGGRSAIPIALAHKYIGYGKLVAIDPWSNEAATEGYSDEHKAWWAKQDLEGIMRRFLQRVDDLQLNDFIDVRRAKSDDVEPPSDTGFVHVDGQHSMQALRDVQRYMAKMPVGSNAALDDVGWVGGGPAAGVQWMLDNGWKQLYPLDTGAIFQRVKAPKKSA